MILEGLVTTLDSDGSVHVAPMGPVVDPGMTRLTLRPFRTSRTYENLKRHGEGVFHVTDDVELIARAAVSEVGETDVETAPARVVRGRILAGAARAYELRVTSLDDRDERTTIEAEVVRCERLRDLFGLNRAKHAVLEAAILASRAAFLPRDEVGHRLGELELLVRKTGGDSERRAFRFLLEHLEQLEQLEHMERSERAAPGDTSRRGPGETPPRSVRVVTGARLHFGLIAPGPGGARRFGGAGAMVERPGVDLWMEPWPEPRAEGPLAERALEVARRFTGEAAPRLRIWVASAPGEHKGLGTGTQLGLAVARAAAVLQGRDLAAAELARRVGRGARSAIGVHGFERGGFIADGGKGAATDGVAPLCLRMEIPDDWRFVIAVPREGRGKSGCDEEEAFREALADPGASEALSHALLMGMAPAVAEGDLRAFGEALHEYGRRAGELFRRAQGGAYVSPEVARLVAELRSEGAAGAGQSSWGPAVYAVADAGRAERIAVRLRERRGADHLEVHATAALNRGAACAAAPIPAPAAAGSERP